MVEQVVVSEPEKEPQSMSERADPRRIAIDRYQLLRVGLLALRAGPLLILVILIGIVVATTPVFRTSQNLGNVLSQTSVISILALGQLGSTSRSARRSRSRRS